MCLCRLYPGPALAAAQSTSTSSSSSSSSSKKALLSILASQGWAGMAVSLKAEVDESKPRGLQHSDPKRDISERACAAAAAAAAAAVAAPGASAAAAASVDVADGRTQEEPRV